MDTDMAFLVSESRANHINGMVALYLKSLGLLLPISCSHHIQIMKELFA